MISVVRSRRTSTSTALRIWLMIVASAAPSTPIPKKRMKQMSSTTFSRELKIR